MTNKIKLDKDLEIWLLRKALKKANRLFWECWLSLVVISGLLTVIIICLL